MKPEWFSRKGLVSRTGFLVSAVAASMLLLTNVGPAMAQDEGAIGGCVTAITGENLTGVQVFIPGTSYGTLSGADCRYRITGVPAGNYTLRASIIGFQGSEMPVTVTAGEVSTADFVLEISAVALDEVVATITGEVRRRELTADIGRIDADVVAENTRNADVANILKGQTSGVQVRSQSGTVGGTSDVRIRGNGSISLSKQPLYVIDGAIIDGDGLLFDQFPDDDSPWVGGQQSSRIGDLNPDEIEKIEVIKGPAASALWGARGNAGVIVITTKKGSTGETRWNARADLGSTQQTTGVQDDWPNTYFDPSAWGFAVDDPTLLYSMNLLRDEGTFRNGLYQNYNGNVNGGAGIWNYFGSVQYLNQKGTIPNNQQERFNFRANFGVDPSSKLNLSFSNGYTSSNTTLPNNDNNVFGYIPVALIGSPRFVPLEGVQDPITGETVDTCPWAIESAKASGEPTNTFSCSSPFFVGRTFEDIESISTLRKIERYTGSGNVTWNPLTQWTNRFTLGYDMVNDRNNQTFPVDPDRPFQTLSLGNVSKPFTSSRNLTMQGTTTYDLFINQNLDFEFTGGVQWFRTTLEGNLVSGQTFPATGPSVSNSVITTSADTFDEQKSIGFFVQGQFGITDRLFVNGALRWDNNSAQGENLGVQSYPKAGISWVALEGGETFNSLRIRGSWGKSGSLPGTNDAKALVQTQQVAFGGSDELGISPQRPGNPLLQPEVGEEWEAGFDLAMLRDRIGLLVTYYNTKTRNSVVTRNLPPSIGFPDQQFTNIGQINNRGFEFELDALAIASENFNWDWRFVVSQNTNNVAELDDPIIFGLGGGSQRHQVGLPFASYVSQLVELDADGTASVVTCDQTAGSWGPDDTPGAKEDFCDPLDDSRYGGQPTGQWFGSAQTTINLFKYVQLFALLDFNTGFEQLNYNGRFICTFQRGACGDYYQTNSGTVANGTSDDLTDEAKIKRFAAPRSIETPWFETGDWAKLRTVQLRFDMPPSVLQFLKVSGLQFQFIGENLVSWSSYGSQMGLDPEVSVGLTAGGGSRSEFLTLPPTKRFIGTINIFF